MPPRPPGSPHYYTLKDDWADPAQFVWTVEEVRKHEIVRPLTMPEMIRHQIRHPQDVGYMPGGWQQRYLDVNGCSYWTAGNSARDTSIIYRQYSSHGAYEHSSFNAVRSHHSTLGDLWLHNVRYGDGRKKQHYAFTNPRGRVLDIGCGTGLVVDYCYDQIDRKRYVGIDPRRHDACAVHD